jgi:hypothetical protein
MGARHHAAAITTGRERLTDRNQTGLDEVDWRHQLPLPKGDDWARGGMTVFW